MNLTNTRVSTTSTIQIKLEMGCQTHPKLNTVQLLMVEAFENNFIAHCKNMHENVACIVAFNFVFLVLS